ncbi:MAG: ComEC/Rec2 family competence protein [Planctomycetota bacterium]
MDTLTPPKPLYWVAVAFISGIFTASYLPQLSSFLTLSVLGFLGALALILYLAKRGRFARTVILLAMCFLGGIFRLDSAQSLPADHIARLFPGDMQVSAEGIVIEEPVIYQPRPNPIDENPRPDKPYGNFVLDIRLIACDGITSTARGLVRVNFTGPAGNIRYGDRVSLDGLMYAPAGPTNPGEFDYRQYLFRQGVYLIIKCNNTAKIKVLAPGQGSAVFSMVYGIRRAVSGKIDRMFSARRVPFFDEQSLANTASLIKTLLLGDRSSFPQDIQDKFMRTGTIHYLSVSGAHLAIVVAICFMVCWWVGITGRARIVVTLIAAVGYTAVTGLYTPIVRSLVMVFCFLGTDIFNRKANSLNSLSLAALIIALYNPFEVFNIGAQLSFISVLFLIILSPHVYRIIKGKPAPEETLARILPQTLWDRIRRNVKDYLIGSVAVSVSVWGGLMILTLRYFNIITPSAILANIALSCLIFVLMLLGFATLPFILIGEIVVVLVTHSLCWLINGLVDLIARIPLAYIYLPDMPDWFAGVFYGLLFASLLLVGRSWIIRYLALGARVTMIMMTGLAVAWVVWTGIAGRSPLYQAPDSATITMLDVRQGSAMVLETPDGQVTLLDAGTIGNKDVGRSIIAPYLWQRGINRIDNLILSHPHPDHINGVPSLNDRFHIREVAVSKYFTEDDAGKRLLNMLNRPLRIIHMGDVISIGNNFRAEALGPPDDMPYHKTYLNDASLVLKLSNGVLLCNDVEKKGIKLLMNNPLSLTGITVMQLPHHGFASGFSPEFINTVKPHYAMLNCDGKRLAGGLLEFCRDSGIMVLSSYEYGALTLSLSRAGLRIQGYCNDTANSADW